MDGHEPIGGLIREDVRGGQPLVVAALLEDGDRTPGVRENLRRVLRLRTPEMHVVSGDREARTSAFVGGAHRALRFIQDKEGGLAIADPAQCVGQPGCEAEPFRRAGWEQGERTAEQRRRGRHVALVVCPAAGCG